MHQSKHLILLSLLTLVLCTAQVRAQDAAADPAPASEPGPPMMRGMSPEERQAAFAALSAEDQQIVRKRQRAARDQQREEWAAMTPDEREVRRDEMRARAEELTPEQRQAFREWREKNQKSRRVQPPALEKNVDPPADPDQQ